MKITHLLITLLLCLCFQSVQAKVALVIGNDAYNSTHFSSLDKAVSDASLLADKLRSLGFDVIEEADLNYEQMLKALDKFSDKLRQTNDVGVFYFAGHGIQEGGRNYLIPLKANIEFSSDAKTNALDANVILNRMQSVNSHVNIFILDACRDNTLPKRRGGKTGLANLAHENTFIAYATQPGKYALDGYFVPSLVKWMEKPLSIGEMFLKVVADVRTSTNGEQIPSFTYNLRKSFYFYDKVLERLQNSEKVMIDNRINYAKYAANNCSDNIRFWQEAADHGYSIAQFFLGSCYNYGQGISKNSNLAKQWFLKSANQGHAHAQIAIGLMYWDIDDYEKSKKWLTKAEKQGFDKIGDQLYTNILLSLVGLIDITDGDLTYKLDLLHKAERRGSASALNSLGNAYRSGEVVRLNYEKAMQYYRQAEEFGYSMALLNIGIMYRDGKGVSQNYNEAFRYLKKALRLAKNEHEMSTAELRLGRMYENGLGVPKSREKALAFYRKAEQHGHLIAGFERMNLERSVRHGFLIKT